VKLSGKQKTVILLLIILLFPLIQHIFFVYEEEHSPSWDQSWHAMISTAKYKDIAQDGFNIERTKSIYPIMSWAINYYPPFYHIMTFPFYFALGLNYNSALMSNALFLAVLILSMFFIGKKIAGTNAGLLAAFMISLSPLYTALMKTYLIDFALCSMVALGYCLLLYSEDFSKKIPAISFAVVFSLGMMTKWTYVLYLIIPLALSALKVMRSGKKDMQNIFIFAVILMLSLTFLWYTPEKISSLTQQLSKSSSAGSAENDPTPFSFDGALYYPIHFVKGFSFLLTVAFIFSAVFIFWNFQKKNRAKNKNNIIQNPHHINSDSAHTSAVIFAQIIFSLVVFSLISNKDIRYIAPVLVFTTAIIGIGFSAVSRSTINSSTNKNRNKIILTGITIGFCLLILLQNVAINHTEFSTPVAMKFDFQQNISNEKEIIDALNSINADSKERFSLCIIAESESYNDVNIPYYLLVNNFNAKLAVGNGCNPWNFDYVILGPISETWREKNFLWSRDILETNKVAFIKIYNGSDLEVHRHN
jgi:4-amino-4-deoxy-L-arabinose transferase-like glycosyltransferase